MTSLAVSDKGYFKSRIRTAFLLSAARKQTTATKAKTAKYASLVRPPEATIDWLRHLFCC